MEEGEEEGGGGKLCWFALCYPFWCRLPESPPPSGRPSRDSVTDSLCPRATQSSRPDCCQLIQNPPPTSSLAQSLFPLEQPSGLPSQVSYLLQGGMSTLSSHIIHSSAAAGDTGFLVCHGEPVVEATQPPLFLTLTLALLLFQHLVDWQDMLTPSSYPSSLLLFCGMSSIDVL